MNHPRLREQAPSSPGVIPLTCAAIRRVRGSYFDLGNEIDHLFSPYQLKALTRHSDPGYNVLQLRFYRTFTSSGIFKPKKCCHHQHKQPGQINAADNHLPATRASGRASHSSLGPGISISRGGRAEAHSQVKRSHKSAQNSRHDLHA